MEKQNLFEKQFTILQEISSAIVGTANVTAISNYMLDLATNYTNAEKGSLMLINQIKIRRRNCGYSRKKSDSCSC
jgi:hypothetical protein